MSLESSNIGWWKLENRFAETGQDFTDHGMDFTEDMQFGKGAKTVNTANYLDIPSENFFTPNKNIVETWFKSDGWNCVNGAASDGSLHFWLRVWYDPLNAFDIFTRNTVAGTEMRAVINGVSYAARFTTGLNFNAGDPPHHIAFLWERNGTPDEERLIYFDGNKLTPTSWSGAHNPVNQPLTGGDLYLLRLNSASSTFKGTFDNTKMYNEASLIINDVENNKFNEGFPVAGYPITNKYNFDRLNQVAC